MEPCGEGGCWFLYYAYGSNLLRERLLLRNPSAALCAPARLQVREGAAGGAAGAGGSPAFLQGARVSPRSRTSPRLPAGRCCSRSVPPAGEDPARIGREDPRQDDGGRFCTVVPSDRTRSDGRKLKRKEFHLSMRSSFFTLRVAEH